jgi:peptidoglycan/LPS O-acetylase OafA/YrhL
MVWSLPLQRGVDLFFVLSGWLIGTLYWKELKRFENVSLLRFWFRRWARTIPPYLVVLLLAWLAVYVARREPFDWRYLLFIQNYSQQLPFFSVSWSLCVEEHFYVFLPLLLLPFARSRAGIILLFGLLILSAPIGRWWVSQNGLDEAFGFQHTATHLRLEGLVLGFGAAYLPVFMPNAWKSVQRHSRVALGAAIVLLSIFLLLNDLWQFRIGLTLLSVGLLSLTIFFLSRKPGRLASSRAVGWIAVSSYSIYLTHPLVLQVAMRISQMGPPFVRYTYLPIAIFLVATAGASFYFALERTSIKVRDRLVPRRRSITTAAVRNLPVSQSSPASPV